MRCSYCGNELSSPSAAAFGQWRGWVSVYHIDCVPKKDIFGFKAKIGDKEKTIRFLKKTFFLYLFLVIFLTMVFFLIIGTQPTSDVFKAVLLFPLAVFFILWAFIHNLRIFLWLKKNS